MKLGCFGVFYHCSVDIFQLCFIPHCISHNNIMYEDVTVTYIMQNASGVNFDANDTHSVDGDFSGNSRVNRKWCK